MFFTNLWLWSIGTHVFTLFLQYRYFTCIHVFAGWRMNGQYFLLRFNSVFSSANECSSRDFVKVLWRRCSSDEHTLLQTSGPFCFYLLYGLSRCLINLVNKLRRASTEKSGDRANIQVSVALKRTLFSYFIRFPCRQIYEVLCLGLWIFIVNFAHRRLWVLRKSSLSCECSAMKRYFSALKTQKIIKWNHLR